MITNAEKMTHNSFPSKVSEYYTVCLMRCLHYPIHMDPAKESHDPSMARAGREQGTNGHIAQAKDQLMGCVERRNRVVRPAGIVPLGPKEPRAPSGPARKSTRLEGRPAPIYNEAALEKADGVERKKRGHLPEHHGAIPSPFSC